MKKILFDSHSHLNNERYKEKDVANLAREIEESELAYVMDIGFDLPSSALAAEHAEKYPWCYGAVGCHPHDAKTMDDNMLKLIESLAKKEKIKAIGEIGLDFHYDFSDRDVQELWFRKQIQLANKLGMPIVIHSREADEPVMHILKEEGAFSEERKAKFPKRINEMGEEVADARVLLHCYSGSSELAKQYVKLGATISIAGPVTYKNARKTVKVVEDIPLEFLLIETDAPYLTPEPHRGKPNKSPYVRHTAEKVAEIKGISFEEVAARTCENAKIFFDI